MNRIAIAVPPTMFVICALVGCTAEPEDGWPAEQVLLETEGDDEAGIDELDLHSPDSTSRRGCGTDAHCEDGNVCTTAQCIEHKCVYIPLTGPCDDGDACTLQDACVAGVCQGTDEVMLLSGAALPAAEGWTPYGDSAESTNGTVVNVDTTSIPLSYRYSTFGLPITGALLATHDLEWRLTVHYADHNPYDASVAMLPSFTGWYGWGSTERSQMIYFEEDEIGWGDESGSYAVNATLEHAYRLHVKPTGEAEVYVDNQLALTRSNVAIGPMVGFGDQTNDSGVDGDFDIRSLRLIPSAQCKTLSPRP